MPRLLVLALALSPSLAAAEPDSEPESFELGGFLGPRFFSQVSALGYIDDAPGHPMLENSVELGARVSHPFIVPWLNPELELAISPTQTHEIVVNGADIPSVAIFWMEPRVQLRFDPLPHRRIQPLIVIGAGAPIQLSAARKTINSGVIGDGYFGGGVRLDTGKGFTIRFDARLAFIPGVDMATGDNKLGIEANFNLGVQLAPSKRQARDREVTAPPSTTADRDGDGIVDANDKCPDRAEDKDGFEDQDGCPDIDNDGDKVLDVADKCPNEPETMNGFEDEDGCPDTVPADVDAIKGTLEGVIYAEGETAVHDSGKPTLRKIAKVMQAHPSIKIVLVGHTDDREAKAFVVPPEPGQPAPTVETVATDLARVRAEAVRQALGTLGVAQGRVIAEGVGADAPVADNATRKGRFANRRVELKLFVATP
jgi:outer membrane protein OmpA-like peptidoglycan-associated protein